MKRRGYAAPLIVAGILLLYYIGVAVLLLCLPGIVWWAKALLCIVPGAVGALIIGVTVQRLREIRSGETNDLDKY